MDLIIEELRESGISGTDKELRLVVAAAEMSLNALALEENIQNTIVSFVNGVGTYILNGVLVAEVGHDGE